jgi:hypothetical protein
MVDPVVDPGLVPDPGRFPPLLEAMFFLACPRFN